MAGQDSDLDETPVRIAGTRPAMRFGLPIFMWAVLMVLGTELFVIHKPWAAFYVTLSVGFLSWIAFRHDHNIARVELAYWRTRGSDMRRFLSSGRSSVSAMPIKPGRMYRGVPAEGWRPDSAGI